MGKAICKHCGGALIVSERPTESARWVLLTFECGDCNFILSQEWKRGEVKATV